MTYLIIHIICGAINGAVWLYWMADTESRIDEEDFGIMFVGLVFGPFLTAMLIGAGLLYLLSLIIPPPPWGNPFYKFRNRSK